ncbi:hypothetical protein HPB51_022919 [Rhipicephalus microplus]|uniref:DUF5641 domain-containing protein n=1 Tax=Rhipicephalus microplus TaxID=6941 RepID=A0A9J6DR45_RHIMP|nr:hypothetical protein HPB51_022919 [Rhipicephalus microplus]
MPELGVTAETSTHAELQVQYWKRISMQLWQRWKSAYLLQLGPAHCHPERGFSLIRMSDVVTVLEDKTSPTFWELGRVTSLQPVRDGVARTCSARFATGHVLNRPVQKLCVMEATK